MKSSELLERSFPKQQWLDFAQTQLHTVTYRSADGDTKVLFIPLTDYLRVVEALTFAAGAIRILEAELESAKQSAQAQ